MSNENKISRRTFIKDAAVAGAAAATAGVLGTTAAQAQSASSGLPTKWDKETDVVVVGTGCGQAAAIEAKLAGADVLIVEKNDWVGGLYICAGGNSILGATHIQKKLGVEDSLEAWYEDELYGCDHRGVPELIKTYVNKGPEIALWLESLGIVWKQPLSWQGPETNRVTRTHTPAASATNYPEAANAPGMAYVVVMQKKLKSLGVPVLLKHRMTRVYRNGSGPVVGIEVKNETGTINIKARKAVILCTGTWSDNARMAAAWDPRIVGQDCYGDGGTPNDGKLFVNSSGDGHLAAAEIGAGFSDMSYVSYLYLFFGARSYWGWDPADFTNGANKQNGRGLGSSAEMCQRTILIKNDGARYINEAEGARVTKPWAENRKLPVPEAGAYSENPEWPWTASYLSLPQPRNVWAITDADGAAALKWPANEFKNPNFKRGVMLDPTCVAVADSLAELAGKMGIDPAKVQATVTKYNGFVDAGKDADFGKPMPLYKIAKPPFYAAKASLIRHTQRNGVRVNTKSQVIEQSDQRDGAKPVSIDQEKVIPHLYAAGELGNIMGWRRNHGSLSNYLIFARIAGQNAAKEAPVT